jgi:hypothetical protein
VTEISLTIARSEPAGVGLGLHSPPLRALGIVTQNGNAYTDGFGPGVPALADWWKDRAAGHAAVDGFLTVDGNRLQWEAGARDPETVDPAAWTLDRALLDQPGRKQAADAQLWDYQNNHGRYPEWQAYLREHQPPRLAIWGDNDPFFIAPGAEAYKRDVPEAEIVLLDTGHFALSEEVDTIASAIDELLTQCATHRPQRAPDDGPVRWAGRRAAPAPPWA